MIVKVSAERCSGVMSNGGGGKGVIHGARTIFWLVRVKNPMILPAWIVYFRGVGLRTGNKIFPVTGTWIKALAIRYNCLLMRGRDSASMSRLCPCSKQEF